MAQLSPWMGVGSELMEELVEVPVYANTAKSLASSRKRLSNIKSSILNLLPSMHVGCAFKLTRVQNLPLLLGALHRNSSRGWKCWYRSFKHAPSFVKPLAGL